MIRHAEKKDVKRLKRLWRKSFHDPLNYVDFIYEYITTPADTLVYEANGKIASMLTIIPVNFVYQNETVKTMYVYGAATDRRYQGKGYMSKLLKYAEDYARGFGFQMSVLVPGDKFLFRFYKARGYSANFNCRILKIKPGIISPAIVPDAGHADNIITPEQLFNLRKTALADTPHIEWNIKQLEFIFEDSRLYNERIAYYNGVYGESYAVYAKDKKGMFIKECLGTSKDASLCLIKDMIIKNDPKDVSIVLPAESKLFEFEGELARYGMAKLLDNNISIKDIEPYMNLMLD